VKLEKVLRDLGYHDKELSLLFTDDNRMAQLNLRYLGREGPTDVLAFPMADPDAPADQTSAFEPVMLGDVVISVDTALSEADEFGEPLEHVIDRLLIHGILHLSGYDHEASEEGALLMEKEEKRLMALIEVSKMPKVQSA
jgi:rRNA maturation RNase YbeY